MKVRIYPYLVFFVTSLLLAFYVSQSDLKEESDGKVWVNISRPTIQKVILTDESATVTVSRASKGSDAFWLQSLEQKKSGDNMTEIKDRYLVGERFTEVLDALSPFRVEKIIGEPSKVNLADFGLDKPLSSFEVHYGDDKIMRLDIGKRSFQSPHVFALDKDKGVVLLIDRKPMMLLDKPKARMAMVKPYSFAESDILSATVSFDNKTEKFQKKTQGQTSTWFAESKASSPSETFRNWLDKALKLRVESFPTDEQLKLISTLTPRFTIQFKGSKGELDAWGLLEEQVTPPKYWLKSEKLPVAIQIEASKAAVLLDDLKAFFP